MHPQGWWLGSGMHLVVSKLVVIIGEDLLVFIFPAPQLQFVLVLCPCLFPVQVEAIEEKHIKLHSLLSIDNWLLPVPWQASVFTLQWKSCPSLCFCDPFIRCQALGSTLLNCASRVSFPSALQRDLYRYKAEDMEGLRELNWHRGEALHSISHGSFHSVFSGLQGWAFWGSWGRC